METNILCPRHGVKMYAVCPRCAGEATFEAKAKAARERGELGPDLKAAAKRSKRSDGGRDRA